MVEILAHYCVNVDGRKSMGFHYLYMVFTG